jgi:hypothetical protein
MQARARPVSKNDFAWKVRRLVCIPNRVEKIEASAFRRFSTDFVKKYYRFCFQTQHYVVNSTYDYFTNREDRPCFDGEVVFEGRSRLRVIGRQAFECAEMPRLTIPDTVEIIAHAAFRFSNISYIRFAPGCPLAVIPTGFCADSLLRSIHPPDNVTEIGDSSFEGAYSLQEVVFSVNSRLTYIHPQAFFRVKQDVFVLIPASFPDASLFSQSGVTFFKHPCV